MILIILLIGVVPTYASAELSTDDLFWLGYKYESERNYVKAIDLYTEVIKRDPNYKDIYAVRGLAYIWAKNYDLALADYFKAVELTPNNSGLYHNIGNIYRTKGNLDLAIEWFTKSIEIKDDSLTRRARGITYFELQKYDLAMNDFNRADELWPNRDEFLICKASLYGFLEKYDECITVSEEGLNKFANHPVFLFLIGQSYEQQGNTGEALSYYKKAYENQRSDKITWRFIKAVKAKLDARLANDWVSYKEWVIAF